MKVEGVGSTFDLIGNGPEVGKNAEKIREPEKKQIKIEDLKSSPKADEQSLQKTTELLNQAMKIANYHLEFKLYKDTGRYQVKVVDTESQQVIRELPPDDVLEFQTEIIAMLDKMVGLLVDEIA